MARYRSDLDDDRDYYRRDENLRRENFGRFDPDRRPDYNRGRFGERAEYDYDEPRYAEQRRERWDDSRNSALYNVRGDLSSARYRDRDYYASERSRLRCRDIMTRDLVVATRDSTLTEIARMMKQEDVGVIPVVQYDIPAGNG